MKILITVCARGGSKGVKNKNIKPINGKPLIAYTLEVAKALNFHTRIVCSTDSIKIAEIAKDFGAEVPFMRPPILASDSAGKVSVIRYTANKCEEFYGEKYDFVIDLDVTAPLRKVSDIVNCINLFLEKKPSVLVSAVPSRRSPYFNMVEKGDNGFFHISKSLENPILRRQDAPLVFDLNTSIYIYSNEFLSSDINSVTSTDRLLIYKMNELFALDIDSELDFKYIEFLIKEGVVEL